MSKRFFAYYSVDIAANSTREINVFGRFMSVLSWDGTLNPKIRIGDQPEEEIPAGLSIELPDGFFGKALIRNPNASTQTLVIAFSAGKIYDRRLTLSGSELTSILAEMQGSTSPQGYGLVTIGTSTTEAVASNTSRKSVLIQNPPTNTGLMYIGFDNTLTTSKYACVLSPGQIYSCDDYRGAVYCLGTVAAEKVSYGEV